jgi:hypothetical protein
MALEATLEWIDAVPKNISDRLPTMPGFDRDCVNDLLVERYDDEALKF